MPTYNFLPIRASGKDLPEAAVYPAGLGRSPRVAQVDCRGVEKGEWERWLNASITPWTDPRRPNGTIISNAWRRGKRLLSFFLVLFDHCRGGARGPRRRRRFCSNGHFTR